MDTIVMSRQNVPQILTQILTKKCYNVATKC